MDAYLDFTARSPAPAALEDQLIASLAAVIPTLPRRYAAALAEMAVARLDDADGDPDEEADGDELDGNASEDDFMTHWSRDGAAGCPIADPGECDDGD